MGTVEDFTKIRRILYSTFHKGEQGRSDAFEYLEKYKNKLGARSYVGLKAEMGFYQKYRKEFALSVAADVGDHTDFSGNLGSQAFRFDVTTNVDYKKLKDYEPLQKDAAAQYKIAVVNHSGDIEDLIDINFPFCPDCGEGRLIDMVVLLPENYNDEGEARWTNDQSLIGICHHCEYFTEYNRISTHFLFDFTTEIKTAWENEQDAAEETFGDTNLPGFDGDRIIQSHTARVLPYLHREFDKSIMALCDRSYKVVNPKDGDGHQILKVQWKKNYKFLEDYIHREYDIEFH